MTKTVYGSSSPYSITPQTSWYLGPIKLHTIFPDSTDYELVIATKYHNRPDKLSQDLYGTPAYWWIFSVRNPNLVRDPIWEFTSGLTIFVITPSRLSTLLT